MPQPGQTNPVRVDLGDLIGLRQLLVRSERHRHVSRAMSEGSYQARARGRGMTFAEVRAYQSGDDVRLIDWRVTARTGKPHTKVFDEERERPVLVGVDYRRPMFFATRGCFKAVQATRLAALLGWRALERNDRFGAFLFSEERTLGLRPQLGKNAVLNVLRELATDPAWARDLHRPFEPRQRLEQTLAQMHRVVRPGSFVVLISDFNQWNEEVEKQISLLTRHCDLCLVQCYDPFEATLPAQGTLVFSDGSNRAHLEVGTRTRLEYQQRFARMQEQLKDFCLTCRAAYIPCSTIDSVCTCAEAVQPLFTGRR